MRLPLAPTNPPPLLHARAHIGDGFSNRFEDSVLHGCIPVIAGQDGIEMPFSSVLDMDLFTLRVDRAELKHIPKILKAIPQKRVRELQLNLAKVWRRCARACACACVRARRLGGDRRWEAAHCAPCPLSPLACARRYLWTSHRPYAQMVRERQVVVKAEMAERDEQNEKEGKPKVVVDKDLLPAAELDFDPTVDDAFTTMIEWLYSRIPQVKAHPPTR